MELKTILKKLMREHNITLTALSKRTGVPKQTLHNWECGSEPKNLNQVRQVAHFFELSIEEFCFGQEMTKKSQNSQKPFKEFEDEINAGIFEVVLRRVNITDGK